MSNPQIIMIEDNPLEIDLLRRSLDQLGEHYELLVLRDGAEAIRYVRESHPALPEPEPCIILLNLHLPKYDGLEVLEALKRDPVLGRIEVIILTSGAIPRREQAVIRQQGAIFRQKPGSLEECLQLAADVIDLCRAPALAD